ncbi:hypothetical protein, partial [Pseudomonas oryzihabitans]
VCLRLPAYSASAKVICFMEKLGWRDRRISPDSGSLFQTFPKAASGAFFRRGIALVSEANSYPSNATPSAFSG